jgi:hypothetical protein
VQRPVVELHAGEVLSIEVHVPVADKGAVSVLKQRQAEVLGDKDYTELSRRPDADGAIVAAPIENILPDSAYFQPRPDRWNTKMPNYHRYNLGDETPYVLGHWYDPFNRNRLKATSRFWQRLSSALRRTALRRSMGAGCRSCGAVDGEPGEFRASSATAASSSWRRPSASPSISFTAIRRRSGLWTGGSHHSGGEHQLSAAPVRTRS